MHTGKPANNSVLRETTTTRASNRSCRSSRHNNTNHNAAKKKRLRQRENPRRESRAPLCYHPVLQDLPASSGVPLVFESIRAQLGIEPTLTRTGARAPARAIAKAGSTTNSSINDLSIMVGVVFDVARSGFAWCGAFEGERAARCCCWRLPLPFVMRIIIPVVSIMIKTNLIII